MYILYTCVLGTEGAWIGPSHAPWNLALNYNHTAVGFDKIPGFQDGSAPAPACGLGQRRVEVILDLAVLQGRQAFQVWAAGCERWCLHTEKGT